MAIVSRVKSKLIQLPSLFSPWLLGIAYIADIAAYGVVIVIHVGAAKLQRDSAVTSNVDCAE